MSAEQLSEAKRARAAAYKKWLDQVQYILGDEVNPDGQVHQLYDEGTNPHEAAAEIEAWW